MESREKAREYLRKIKKYDFMIENRLLELMQYRYMITSISAIDTSEKVKSSTSGDKLASAIVTLIEKEKEIESLVDDYIKIRDEIVYRIELIENPEEYEVLNSIYVEGRTYREISERIGYEVRQIGRIHKKGLDNFAKKYFSENS